MFNKLDIIKPYQNYIRSDFPFFLLELFFENRRWMHANPTIYAQDDSYKKYYLEDAVSSICKEFNKSLTKNEGTFIVLKGKRGSGKTSFLNYFLNKNTRKLNKKGLTWVRIDCTKIFRNEIAFGKELNFEEYFLGQLLFVYFRYLGNVDSNKTRINPPRNSGKNGCDAIVCSPIDSYDEVFQKINLKQRVEADPELLNAFEEARKQAQDAPHWTNTLEGKPFAYKDLGLELLKLVHDKLILIIDGMDNISYDSLVKNKVWDGLEKFLTDLKEEKIPKPKKIVLSLRDENYLIFAKRLSFLNPNDTKRAGVPLSTINEIPKVSFIKFIERFEENIRNLAKAPSFDEEKYRAFLIRIIQMLQLYLKESRHFARLKEEYLLRYANMPKSDIETYETMRKIEQLGEEALRKASVHVLEKHLNHEIFSTDKELMEHFRACGRQFGDAIEQAVAYLYAKEQENDLSNTSLPQKLKAMPITHYFIFAKEFSQAIKSSFEKRNLKAPDDVQEEFFNGDLREMFVLSYKSYSYLSKLIPVTYKAGDPDELENYLKNNVLNIMRPVFTNGNKFMITRDEIMFHPPYRNISTINLLNVNDVLSSEYSPLYTFYLLKFLETSYSFEAIKERFSTLSDVYIEKMLNNFLEFGYIELTPSEDEPNSYNYKLTQKGKNFFAYSLHDILVMHSYLFGGLVDEFFVPFLKKQVDFSYRDYNILDENKFASALLVNMSVLYYMLEVEQGNLILKNQEYKDLKIELISQSVRKSFEGYFDRNPYLFKDLGALFYDVEDTYTPEGFPYHGRWIYKNISDFVREKLLFYTEFKEFYAKKLHREMMRKSIDALEMRYAFLHYIIGIETKEMVENIKHHKFLFGDVPEEDDEIAERLEKLEGIDQLKFFQDVKNLLPKIKKELNG